MEHSGMVVGSGGMARGSDGETRSAAHGIRWHETLPVPANRPVFTWFPWEMIIAVAALAAVINLIGL